MQQIVKQLASSTPFKRVLGRSYAAAAGGAVAAASGSDVQRSERRRRKRVTVHQRKAMLESYVNEYRAMNSGKFPTASNAQKQVGGGFYVIKKLVQELEYQSKMSTTSIKDDNIKPKDIAGGNKLSNDSEVSSTNTTHFENVRQEGKTRDGILSVEEVASDSKYIPDVAQVSGSEITVGADTCEDTRRDKETLVIKNLHGENESTVMEKVTRVQTTLDTEINEDAGVQRDGQTSLGTEAANKIKSSTEVEESSFSQSEKHVVFPGNDKSSIVNDVDSVTFIANNSFTSTSSEKTSSEEIARPLAASDRSEAFAVKDHQLKEEAVSSHPSSHKGEDNVKAETASGDMWELNRLEPGAEQMHQQEKKSETLARDLSKEQQGETQPQKKSFMWESLKSLANGITTIWRKL